MGLFTTLNPFYWKKRALQAEKDYEFSCESFNHLQDENVELKQRIEILSESYQYPDLKDLVNGYALAMIKPDAWKNIDTGVVLKTFTKKEVKLLLDNELLKQQLETHEQFCKELSTDAGFDVIEKVSNLTAERDTAKNEALTLSRKLKSTQTRLQVVEAELERSKNINAKWFEIALGYGVNDFTLLTKSLRGSKVGIAEFDNGKDG